MKPEDLTNDQAKLLAFSLLRRSFDRKFLSDSSDAAIAKISQPLLDAGLVIYRPPSASQGKYDGPCFKTTKLGRNMFVEHIETRMANASPKERKRMQRVWGKMWREINQICYEIQDKRKRQKIRQAWQALPFEGKLMAVLFFTPLLYVVWMTAHLAIKVILGA